MNCWTDIAVSLLSWGHTDRKLSRGDSLAHLPLPQNETTCKFQPVIPSCSKRQRRREQFNLELRGRPADKTCLIHLGSVPRFSQKSCVNIMSLATISYGNSLYFLKPMKLNLMFSVLIRHKGFLSQLWLMATSAAEIWTTHRDALINTQFSQFRRLMFGKHNCPCQQKSHRLAWVGQSFLLLTYYGQPFSASWP